MDILYAWIASIASGITPLVIKASSKSLVKNPWLFNILWTLFSIPFIGFFALIKGGGLPQNWYPLLLLSLSYAGFYAFYTVALYRIDVSTMAPLFSLRTVFAVLLGVTVLHESIGITGAILITFIVIMSPFAAYNEALRLRAFFHIDVLLGILAMGLLALVGYFTNISVHQNGFATTLLWQDILTLLILLPTLLLVKPVDRKISLQKLVPFLAIGLMDFLYTATATLAFAHSLALSSVIVSLPLSMVFAFLLSRRYSKFLEEHSLQVYAVRFFGASIMIGCAIWLSLL
jgi:drug/metabolite transporter (DMT)-like permease